MQGQSEVSVHEGKSVERLGHITYSGKGDDGMRDANTTRGVER